MGCLSPSCLAYCILTWAANYYPTPCVFKVHTFSKQGLILRAMLMRIGLTCPSSICWNMRANPDIASIVMRSSGSSRSSIPANIALRMVVENCDTYRGNTTDLDHLGGGGQLQCESCEPSLGRRLVGRQLSNSP